jgi:hypothetical protein
LEKVNRADRSDETTGGAGDSAEIAEIAGSTPAAQASVTAGIFYFTEHYLD